MEKPLEGSKILLIVPPTQFREEEVFEPQRILEEQGCQIVVASTVARICHGTRGGTVEATLSFEEVTPDTFDAVVLAGGLSVPELFWKDKKLHDLIASVAEAGKIVAAISLSTVVLAKANLLAGREATVYYLPEAIDELKSSGALYTGKKLIVDGKLIMAEGPESVGSFTEAIVSSLSAA